MESVRESLSGSTGIFVRIVFILLSFYLLYVIYKFLYSTPNTNDISLMPEVTLGRPSGVTVGGNAPLKTFQSGGDTSTPKIMKLATGKEFSLTFWLYIKEINWQTSKNKFILSLGEQITGKQSLLVYLSAYQYSLHVRTNASSNNPDTRASEIDDIRSTFTETVPQIEMSGNSSKPCDINNVDLQKWLHVSIVSSSKTLDVYIDGKLARSCILPRNITFGTTTYLHLFAFNGFGGYMSNLTAHDYSLNPEQIWSKYMSGPGPKFTLLEYFNSLFKPDSVGSLVYPAYPSGEPIAR
jgi:hypothetical protein